MFLFYRYFANMTTIQSNQYAKFHSNIRNYVNSNFSQIILNFHAKINRQKSENL